MLKNYIKMAFKVLLRRKVFTCISLVTISFTLMVLMVATALFDHVFGSFPPETRADRTLVLKMLTGEHTDRTRQCISGHLATPFWNGMCPRWIMPKRCPFPPASGARK